MAAADIMADFIAGWTSGMRFQAVLIRHGCRISSAYLPFRSGRSTYQPPIGHDQGIRSLRSASHSYSTYILSLQVRLQSLSSYDGAIHCMSQTFSQETYRGFYKGMAAPLVMAGFLHSTFFLGYSSALAAIEKATSGGAEEKTRAEQRKKNPLGVVSAVGFSCAVCGQCFFIAAHIG